MSTKINGLLVRLEKLLQKIAYNGKGFVQVGK